MTDDRPELFSIQARHGIDRTARQPDTAPRALFVSSPIGLGHARRDVAIARELRALRPELQIDWLAQDPVTRVLQEEGERIHPLSGELASECGHWDAEAGEHDLHCFEALRRMDEIMVANFMVFRDAVAETPYDLWIADEGWEIDHFLHEHPGLKTSPFAWLTDFVGHLPMPDGGEREALLTADYNAEMVEHVEHSPGLRDRAIFIGDPEDIVPGHLGPGLREIRDWTDRHFDFAGYVTGPEDPTLADRAALRAELGYQEHERVCIVTVGGSAVGADLLGRVVAAYPEARRLVPDLRMVVVAGPRIDPGTLPREDGVTLCGYVHQLDRHLAACDVAVVQGGLTTTMELTAAGRPFLYFPLGHHYAQQFHVHHRLQRYRSGRRMEYDGSTSEAIAAAIADEIDRSVDYRAVEPGGARRAATLLADLL